MKLTIFYNEKVSTYTSRGPFCKVCGSLNEQVTCCSSCKKSLANAKYVEMASSSHQICFSNEFAPGWKKIRAWYMGCVFIRGLEPLTRVELSLILHKAIKERGEKVYGVNAEGILININKRMRKLCEFIMANSDLKDVTYDTALLDATKFRILEEAERELMLKK